MESGAVTLEEVAVEEVVGLSSISQKNFVLVCLRHLEAQKFDEENPFGWGKCKKCMPDYLAHEYYKDFIPNHKCQGYIPCRVFEVLPKDENEENGSSA